MRLKRWKSFLCICTSCALLLSTAAYGNPIIITPLEESQVATLGSGNHDTGQNHGGSGGNGTSQGPWGNGGNGAVQSPGVSGGMGTSQSPGGSGQTGSVQSPGWSGQTGTAQSPGGSGQTGTAQSPGGSGQTGTVQNPGVINGNGSVLSPGGNNGSGTNQSPGGANGTGNQGPGGANGTGMNQGPGGTGGTGMNQGPGGANGTGNQGPGSTGTVQGNTGFVDTSAIQKPVIASEGAVLMDAATGKVLFSQNGDKQFYPASITKLMTALLVAENCKLDDKVKFSKTATTNLESGAVSINMTAGDVMTVRQCLYALLLKSANEVANALAEHVAGSNAKFADMMNAKAAALGCTNTHFTNPHGLNDPNHYTSPHDMALIARAAFQNDVVKTVASTLTYTLPPTIKNPSGLTVTMGHKMLNPKDSRYYPGVLGGKTGYTSKAGNTLVTVAERDGVRLIAVVMKSKSTHYTDTKALLDYGFELAKAGALSSGQSSQTNGSAQAGNSGNGTGASGLGWVQDSKGWYYVKNNGARAANEWITLDGVSYWFDPDTYMAKGWRQINGTWYFLRSNGAMAKNQWEEVEQNGQWFYLGADGAMLTNTITPDGYRVDENGVCR